MMDMLAYLAYALYLCVITGGALVAVCSTSLVRAMVGLVGALLGVAGLYLLMQSPFLAFMQLLIYVGAICVIIFFALMLTSAHVHGDESAKAPRSKGLLALLAGGGSLIVLLPAVLLHLGNTAEHPFAVPAPTPLAELGKAFFEQYVLPFELISVILLVAMIGGVFLARERRGK